MRKILFGIVITLVVIFVWKYLGNDQVGAKITENHSILIQEEIKQVGKLIVTEGHFSEVFNYENSKELIGNYFTAEKKALVIVNAEVTVAYDLSQLEYEIIPEHKQLKIISIPEPEIKIDPDLEYYDVQADFFNPFEAADYNAIKASIEESLMKRFENSKLSVNARDRLLSELSKFYILTRSLEWTLIYNEQPLKSVQQLQNLKF
ncbi:MAG: DUF4230 domain-containing protein [Flavobacteriaceae bacterium]|nr:DUF4230 domain-containing protein [Flavobacteriaceae bacterium]